MSDHLIISKDQLGRLEQINKGGTAVIYRLPDLAPAELGMDAEGLVFKAYLPKTLREAGSALRPALRSLVAFRDQRLNPRERREWDREIAWPVRVVVDDAGAAAGIVMALIPARFHQRLVRPDGSLEVSPREVNMLFGDPDTMRRIGMGPTLMEERMRLVGRAAAVYRRMHDHDVVAGDISSRNLVYDIAGGRPAVLVIDADSARIASTRSAFSAQPHSPCWEPPEARGPGVERGVQTMRTDVYKFGLLVIRILDYGRQRSVNRDPGNALGVLRRYSGARAAEMLARSIADRPADRPTMAQWCEALEGRARRAPRSHPAKAAGNRVTAAPRWCRSCGAGPPESGRRCARCHRPLDAPDFGSARLGRLATRGGRLARTVLVVAEFDSGVLILDLDDKPVPMPAAEFDALPPVVVPGPPVRSAAGRMWNAMLVDRRHWSDTAADTAAMIWATTSIGTRRATTVDLITLGRPGPALLNGAETTWWRARAAALIGDVPALLKHLAALPPAGYDARADLLALVFDKLCDDPRPVFDVLRPATPTARALLAALGPAHLPRVPIAAAEFGGNLAEAARRAYLSGNDAWLAALPDEDRAVRHFRALRAYVTSRELRENHLWPHAQPVVRLTERLSFGEFESRPAGDPVAADPSTWARLVPNAVAGRITADPELRERHPEFGCWLDLCALHGAAQRGDWPEILRSAPDVMLDAAGTGIRTEALNLLAYATWQTGKADRALGLLDKALAIRPTPGLLANAALVAADLPGLTALPYLARLGEQPLTRRDAVLRALDLWERQGAPDELPPEVAGLVRAELATLPDDDDLHRRLLTVALRHQSDWLAGRRVLTPRPSRPNLIADWFRSRALMRSARNTECLAQAASRLSALWRLTGRPAWVDDELTWFLSQLAEVFRKDFVSHDNPAPAAEILVHDGLVEPPESWILLVTAGAFLTTGLARKDRSLSAEVEQRLLFDPVTEYGRQRESLPPDVTEQLGASLSTLTTLAARAAWIVAVGHTKRCEPGAVATRSHVERCRRYLALREVLPLHHHVDDFMRDFVLKWENA